MKECYVIAKVEIDCQHLKIVHILDCKDMKVIPVITKATLRVFPKKESGLKK